MMHCPQVIYRWWSEWRFSRRGPLIIGNVYVALSYTMLFSFREVVRGNFSTPGPDVRWLSGTLQTPNGHYCIQLTPYARRSCLWDNNALGLERTTDARNFLMQIFLLMWGPTARSSSQCSLSSLFDVPSRDIKCHLGQFDFCFRPRASRLHRMGYVRCEIKQR